MKSWSFSVDQVMYLRALDPDSLILWNGIIFTVALIPLLHELLLLA